MITLFKKLYMMLMNKYLKDQFVRMNRNVCRTV